MCPGLLLEKHVLSPFQLRVHSPEPYSYESDLILTAILEAESTMDVVLYNPEVDRMETLLQLVLFGMKENFKNKFQLDY